MSQLIAMFCDIDDFCKWFEPLYMQRLLQDGQRHRIRQSQLALSEIMTIIVFFHSSHYRDFKHSMVRTESGGDSTVSPEFVISGVIFHPTWLKSELLNKYIAQSCIALALFPARHGEDLG